MPQAQLEVWRAREELDRKLANMTPDEMQAYFEGVDERVKAVLGIDLNLPVAKPRLPRSRKPHTGS